MSNAAKDRDAERQWLDQQQHTVHDEHDTETDPENLPPLGLALAGVAMVLVLLAAALAVLVHAPWPTL